MRIEAEKIIIGLRDAEAFISGPPVFPFILNCLLTFSAEG
jgi:hypothetical protein